MSVLIIHPDLECKVYVDTELHGLAKADDDYNISLSRGAYWVECVSAENSADRTDFDFRTDGLEHTEHRDIALKPIRYKRLISQYDSVGEFCCGFAEVTKNGESIGYINRNGDIVYDHTTFDEVLPFGRNTICVKKKCLWGIFHSSGKYIVIPQYSLIKPTEHEIAIFCSENKYGLISSNSDIIIDAKYSRIDKIDGVNLFCGVNNCKCCLLDLEGNKLTPLKYSFIGTFYNGLARVNVGDRSLPYKPYQDKEEPKCGKWGFIDENGKEVIPCIYDYVYDFNHNTASVNIGGRYDSNYNIPRVGGKWGWINKLGEYLIYPKYDCISRNELTTIVGINGFWENKFSDEFINAIWGIVDKDGQEVIPCKYTYIKPLHNGLMKVCLNKKYGVIDCNDKVVIPLKYDDVNHFQGNLIKVQIERKYGCIDITTDKEVIPCIYDWVKTFNDSLLAVESDGKWGLIDQSGQIIVPLKYDALDCVNTDVVQIAQVKLYDEWGLLDKNGQEITPCIYEEMNHIYKVGLTKVRKGRKYGLLDEMGKDIIPCEYDSLEFDFYYHFIKVISGHKYGLFDISGKEIIKCGEFNLQMQSNSNLLILN
ncbi:MAG: WG repeat-containing protein [Rikenellaceae bacterium]|nr:WG repeat-containing protein [Rikenellaceae bacterium]